MTHNKKLLIDLCGRLPYGVKISIPDLWTQNREIEKFDEIFYGDDGLCRVNSKGQCIEHIKPYLFPISSMTEEQKNEYYNICETTITEWGNEIHYDCIESIDWLNKNHFDYRGLIPMGLALDATNLNIY